MFFINFDTEKPVYVGSVVKVAGTTGSMYFNPFARLYSFVCPQFENENESSKHFRIKTIQRSSQTSRRLVRRPFSCQQLLKLQLVFLTGFGKFFFYLVRAHSTWPLFLHRSGRPGKVGEQIAQAKVQKNKQQQQQWTTIEHIGCRRVAIIRIAQADFLQGGSAERLRPDPFLGFRSGRGDSRAAKMASLPYNPWLASIFHCLACAPLWSCKYPAPKSIPLLRGRMCSRAFERR
ncbi:hypothetical protein Tsp_03853 [Trichinella spiralis]|uniref:hypothetical protein n=1 Tax=Trichinella spiralis TaxID=6334 RepID=UPI0001EFC2E3|nr:hypothetical protein Tsp_03853 [Trichinella spiralis]